MPKKRSCRRTEPERAMHERAVALRKMTDDQLVAHVDRNFAAGFDAASIGIELTEQKYGERIMAALGRVKGIGAGTLDKVRTAIREAVSR